MNDVILLVVGFGLGFQTMALWGVIDDARAVRRSLAESTAARKRAAGDRYLNSLRLYQLQNRVRG